MVTQALMLAILLSGGGIGCTLFCRKFEEILFLQLMFMVVILYLFGIFEHLRWGVYFLLFAVALAYILALVVNARRKSWKETAKRLFTPAFIAFIFLFCIFNICDVGKLAHSWDEFTHWIDSVKAMTYIDDFITNPKANGYFQSYPPAMALLQYFFQRVYLMVNKGAEFNEWRMYLVFQLFGYSMILQFLTKEEYRYPLRAISHFVLLIFLPLFFYNEYWTTTYIDPFIGILSGCAFARLLFWRFDKKWQTVYISFLCVTLVLSKDVGLYFAILIAIAYGVGYLAQSGIWDRIKNHSMNGIKEIVYPIFFSLMPVVVTLFSKWTWKYELKVSKADISFGGKIDIAYFTKMFFIHNDDTYHQTVVDNFKNAFFDQSIMIGQMGITVSYCALFLLLVCGIGILYYKCSEEVDEKIKTASRITLLIILIMLIFYIYSLGATYVSNFSEYEAVNLASYQRYMNIAYLAVAIVLIEGMVYFSKGFKENIVPQIVLMVLMLVISPLGMVENYLSRDTVRQAKAVRDKYEVLHSLINTYCNGTCDDRIYFISEADGGFDYWVTRFISRPNGFAGSWIWSLGEPQFDGDIWTYNKCTNSDEWMAMLNDGGYTHIALYSVNDYFKEHFSGVFADSSKIGNNTLFYRNRETGLFELCGQ